VKLSLHREAGRQSNHATNADQVEQESSSGKRILLHPERFRAIELSSSERPGFEGLERFDERVSLEAHAGFADRGVGGVRGDAH
jgi:hypothetical protein